MEEIKNISITDNDGNLIANIAIKWETKEVEVISDKEYEVVEMNEVSDSGNHYNCLSQFLSQIEYET